MLEDQEFWAEIKTEKNAETHVLKVEALKVEAEDADYLNRTDAPGGPKMPIKPACTNSSERTLYGTIAFHSLTEMPSNTSTPTVDEYPSLLWVVCVSTYYFSNWTR